VPKEIRDMIFNWLIALYFIDTIKGFGSQYEPFATEIACLYHDHRYTQWSQLFANPPEEVVSNALSSDIAAMKV
jgi:hypothetical protein